ncbi:MAG TPA: hypothetical protein VG714_10575 [Acidobacteriaceae bacterium]|nr:hypothetical protein [Acidobacteriaceae bacterium]
MAKQEPPAPQAQPQKPAPALPASIQLAQTAHQQQTLIQPDAPPDLLLQRPTPVPLVMMWSQQAIPNRPISPPQQPVIANLHSSIQRPNREPVPAEINLSSTNFHMAMPTLPPGTTSPVTVHGLDPIKQMPTVATQSLAEASPARILSLSDRQMQEGPVAVPLANASARPSNSQSLTAGKSDSSNGTGSAESSGKQSSLAAGQSPSSARSPLAGVAGGPGAAIPNARPGGTGAQQGASPSTQASTQTASRALPAGIAPGGGTAASAHPNSGAGTVASSNPAAASPEPDGPGIGSLNPASVKRIVLPKDGQFGVVVVGSSLADEYPETAAIWAGRLVYTVYLHVGLGKSWILQYSLPPGTSAAASGIRPDAPWPYDIVVPRLDPNDYNADALMIHGFVDLSGRFTHLAMVLPQNFPQTKFVLSALQQWQFRSARQNGQPTQVEILLIIPEQDDDN